MRLAVESLWAMAEISSSVPAGLQLVPSPRRRFARKDLAWDYPVYRSRVNAFYHLIIIIVSLIIITASVSCPNCNLWNLAPLTV